MLRRLLIGLTALSIVFSIFSETEACWRFRPRARHRRFHSVYDVKTEIKYCRAVETKICPPTGPCSCMYDIHKCVDGHYTSTTFLFKPCLNMPTLGSCNSGACYDSPQYRDDTDRVLKENFPDLLFGTLKGTVAETGLTVEHTASGLPPKSEGISIELAGKKRYFTAYIKRSGEKADGDEIFAIALEEENNESHEYTPATNPVELAKFAYAVDVPTMKFKVLALLRTEKR